MSHDGNAPAPCSTRIVVDRPAEADRFGPHARVASALTDLVCSETGGRAIGLAGRYGAGKSTVIQLLASRLRPAEGQSLWVFDAWAHEGDPLRRTFLESLITHVKALDWVDAKRWNKKLEELSRRRRETTTRSTPQLSKVGWAIAVATLFIPLGAAMMSATLRESTVTFALNRNDAIAWRTVTSIAFSFAPILAVAGVLLWTWGAYGLSRLRGRPGERPNIGELAAVFVQKGLSHQVTESTEDPQPTSIEFESTFGELMREALSAPERRLAIVIDNLDRIAPADALAVWSTLQTFLHPSGARPAWLSQLWIVMPYDEHAIAKLWEKEENNGGGLATAFLDKSFQLRFDVPLPVLSDWRDFLTNSLAEALPGHSAGEFHTIYRLLVVHRGERARIPTPRELIVFVNQIGALHRQHGHEFPLEHLAYYALLRRDGTDVVEALLDRDVPSERVKALLGADVVDDLAGLEFGVQASKAKQLLLEGPILSALADADGDALGSLHGTSPGFWAVVETALDRAYDDWSADESANAALAAVALEEGGVFDAAPEHVQKSIRNRLTAIVSKVSAWSGDDPRAIRGTLALLRRSPSRAFADHVLSIHRETSRRRAQDAAAPGKALATTLIKDAIGLVEAYRSATDAAARPRGLQVVPGGFEGYLTVLGQLPHIVEEPDHEWDFFIPSLSPGDAIAALAKAIREGGIAVPHQSAAFVMRDVFEGSDWQDVLAATQERLQQSAALPPTEIVVLLEILFGFGDEPAVKKQIQAFVAGGWAAHQLYTATEHGHLDAVARCIAIYMSVDPVLTPAASVVNAAHGYARLKQQFGAPSEGLPATLAGVLRDWGLQKALVTLAEENSAAAVLAGQTLAALAQSEALPEIFSAERVLSLWPMIEPYLPVEAEARLVHALPDLSATAQAGAFRPEVANLYRQLLVAASTERDALAAWCAAGLHGLPATPWERALDGDGDLVELGTTLRGTSSPLALRDALSAPLLARAESVRDGGAVPESASEWPLAFDLLAADHRNVWRDLLLDLIGASAGGPSDAFLAIFGDELAAAPGMKEAVGVRQIVLPMLRERNVSGLAWLERSVASKVWRRGLPKDYQRELRAAIAAVIESRDSTGEPDEFADAIERLVPKLGIRFSGSRRLTRVPGEEGT